MTRPRVVDVGKVVAGIEEMLRRTIGETSTSLADDLWPVLVDPAPPEQPLVNLTVNAGDAVPSGGHADHRYRQRHRRCRLDRRGI